LAYNELTEQFQAFFNNINPSSTYEKIASSEHRNVIKLLEDPEGPSAELSPKCFLQGSYKQDTAIHTINDIDIVALCGNLVHPGNGVSRSWSRDEIFDTLAAGLYINSRYRNKIRYNKKSMCIKVELDIKVEILPAVKKAGTFSTDIEPFRIHDADTAQWIDAYAREHQKLITQKNKSTNNLFKPIIKIFKHLRDTFHGSNARDAISFHIECLLYRVPNSLFTSSIPNTVEKVLTCIANFSPSQALSSNIYSPCGNRLLFSSTEWNITSYGQFNALVTQWSALARIANSKYSLDEAITFWKKLLGEDYFPMG
jgi:hypothetical protein